MANDARALLNIETIVSAGSGLVGRTTKQHCDYFRTSSSHTVCVWRRKRSGFLLQWTDLTIILVEH